MTIQLRRDTAANWTSANPVLASGQPGVETDTIKIKIGDGATAWNALGYLSASVASIVGITGTKAQFDAAVTDGDISYVGHTHAQADVSGDCRRIRFRHDLDLITCVYLGSDARQALKFDNHGYDHSQQTDTSPVNCNSVSA